MKKRKFTLIELMVVVVIIGLLAAIAIPALFSAKEKYRKMKTAKKGIQERAEKQAIDYRSQPEPAFSFPKTENADIKIKLSANSFVSNFKVYTMFDVNFKGNFVFTSANNNQPVRIYFPFPEGTTQASDVLLEVMNSSGQYIEPDDVHYSLTGIKWFKTLTRNQQLAVRVGYNAQGYNKYIYQGPGANQAKSLKIDMELAGVSTELIPPSALQPTEKKDGHLIWTFNNLITNRRIEVELPGEKSPIGRVILLLRLTGLAVFLFGLGFMYMNDLEDPDRLKDFKWGHFLLLALIYSLFFIIFTAFNMGSGMNAALSAILSIMLSLPLLMIHVGRYLGKKFALVKILPLSLFTLIIAINGVYGGPATMFIYIGLTVIAMTFFTLTYKTWSEKRKLYQIKKQDELKELYRQEEEDTKQQQQEAVLNKQYEQSLKGLTGTVISVNNVYKNASIDEFQAKLMLDENPDEKESEIREKINRYLQKITQLKSGFHDLQTDAAEMHAKQDESFQEKHTALDEKLRQNKIKLEQVLCGLQEEINNLKVAREKLKTAKEKLGNSIHCLACGYKHELSKYCPNCGIKSSLKITCKNCGQVYMYPLHLIPQSKQSGPIHCHFCGTEHTIKRSGQHMAENKEE